MAQMAAPTVIEPGETPESFKRRQLIAQALMAKGMSDEPIQHWTQGAARLAQAAIGGGLGWRAEQDQKDAQRQALTDALGALGGGGATQAAPQVQGQPTGNVGAPGGAPGGKVTGYWDTTPSPPRIAQAFDQPGLKLTDAEGRGAPENFSQTAQLLRKFEGFRANPYWDVNAYRVGYGSDTITNPDGSSRKVQPGDRATPAMGEADLNRRIPEFQKTISGQYEQFASLPPNVKAGLTSVGYNYGKLPSPVVAALQTGDPNRVASAVEALSSHNNGINAKRRAEEAAVIRGGGTQVAQAGGSMPAAQPNRDAMLRALANPNLNPTIAGVLAQQYTPKSPTIVPEGGTAIGADGKVIYKAPRTDKVTDEVRQREQAVISRGGNPNDPQNRAFILSGRMPREDQQPLTATDKKFIEEADDMVFASRNAITALKDAKKLSPRAHGFPGAATMSGIIAPIAGEGKFQNTVELDNIVTTNSLSQLKAIFGGAPTEGERKVLLDIQGSSGQPDAVRQKIYDRAIQLAERRLEFNTKRAAELRGGTFYKSGGGQRPAEAAPDDGWQTIDGVKIRKKQ
jgi:GH24 family phage-related lysozyme (muramidase)